MKQVLKLILLFTFLAGTFGQSCATIKSNFSVFVTAGETYQLYLSDLFVGYNLSYSQSAQGYAQIVNSIQSTQETTQAIGTIVGFSHQTLNTFGGSSWAVLAQNSQQYSVLFANTSSTQDSLNLNVSIPVINDANITCFGLQMINSFTVAVDCLNTTNKVNVNYFVNTYSTPRRQDLGTVWSGYKSINGRKGLVTTLGYQNRTFIFRASAYNQINSQGQSTPQTFISVYRVVPQGDTFFLSEAAPLDYSVFNVTSLQIVDMRVQNGRVFVLDRNLGIISFNYEANQAQDISIVNLNLVADALGMAPFGNDELFIVSSKGHIYEYFWQDIQNASSVPNLLFRYIIQPSLFDNLNQIDINTNYLFLQSNTGQIQILKRGQLDSALLQVSLNQQSNSAFIATYSDNLYVVNGQGTFNYNLTRPILQIKPDSSSQQQTFQIQASSTFTNSQGQQNTLTCQSFVNVTVLYSLNNQELYSTGYSILDNFNVDSMHTYAFNLEESYVGANVTYQINTQEQKEQETQGWLRKLSQNLEDGALFNASLSVVQPAQVNFQNLPPASKINFFKTLPINATAFLAYVQDTSQQLYQYTCAAQDPTNPTQVDCGAPTGQTTNLFNITHLGVGLIESNIITVFTMNNDTNHIFSVNQDGSFNQTISVGNLYISDIAVVNGQLYAVYNANSSLQIFDFSLGFPLLYTIDSNYVQGWGIAPWMPLYAHAAPEYSNYIFVETSDYKIVIISLLGNPSLVNIVQANMTKINNLHLSWNVQINPNALIFSYYNFTGTYSEINEYSLADLDNIYQTRNYSQFGQDVYYPPAISASDFNNLFYVLAGKETSQNIHVYRSTVPSLQSLYAVLDINFQNHDPKIRLIGNGVFGFDYLFFLSPANNILQSWFVPTTPQLIISTGISETGQYLTQTQFSVSYLNFSNEVNATLQSNMTIVNSLNYVDIDTESIQNGLSDKLVFSSDQVSNVSFSDDGWWTGSVVGMAISCDNCSSLFSLINHVQQQSGTVLNLTDIADFYQLDSDNLLVLTSDSLYVLNSTLGISNIIQLGVDKNTQQVQRIVTNFWPNNLLNYTFVLAFNTASNQYQAIPIRFNTTVTPFVGGAINLPITSFTSAKFYNNTLYINQNKDLYSPQNGTIHGFQFNFITNSSNEVVQINGTSLSLASFDPVAFDIVPSNNQNIANVFILDRYFGYYVVELNYTLTFTLPAQNSIDLKEQLSQQQIIATLSTQFLNTIITSYDQNTYNAFVLTKQNPSYNVTLTFNQTGFVDATINSAYAAYGNAITLPRFSVQGNLFTALYLNQTTSAVMLAVYDYNSIQSVQAVKGLKDNSIPVVPLKGGVNFTEVYDTATIPVYIDQNQNIWATNRNNGSLSQISYNENLYFVAQSNNFSEQQVNFTVISDFITPGSVFFSVEVSPGSSGSSFKWWIILIVIGGLIVVGAIVFFVYRYYKKKKHADEVEDIQKPLADNND